MGHEFWSLAKKDTYRIIMLNQNINVSFLASRSFPFMLFSSLLDFPVTSYSTRFQDLLCRLISLIQKQPFRSPAKEWVYNNGAKTSDYRRQRRKGGKYFNSYFFSHKNQFQVDQRLKNGRQTLNHLEFRTFYKLKIRKCRLRNKNKRLITVDYSGIKNICSEIKRNFELSKDTTK